MQYRRIVQLVLTLTLVLMLAAPGVSVSAQGPDDMRPLVAADGSFSMSVPADWVTFETDGMFIAANDEAALENVMNNNTADEGQVVMLVLGPAAVLEVAEEDAGADGMTVVVGLAASLATDLDVGFDDPVEMPLPDGRTMVYTEAKEGAAMDVAVLVLDDGSGDYLGMVLVGDSHAIEEDVLFGMMLSLQFGVPADMPVPTETAEVLWLVADPFVNLDGAMDLLSADEVVISDGGNGLVVYSVDGALVTAIQNDTMFTISSPAVTADGNIWVTDMFNGNAALLAPDGTILLSFGGEDVFGMLSPDFIALGPDGNLYLTNNDEEGYTFIHVYTVEGEFVNDISISDADSFIWSVDMGPDGRLYVVDLGASAIRVYAPDGELLDDSFAQQATFFMFVTAFAALDDGTYLMGQASYEGDEDVYEIVHLDAEGNVTGVFAAADLGLDMLYTPLDFVQTADGDVIVSAGDVDASQLFRMHIAAQ